MSHVLPRSRRPSTWCHDDPYAGYNSFSAHPYEGWTIRVRCSGQLHRIMLTRKGRLVFCDHNTKTEAATARAVVQQLGGGQCRCMEIKEAYLEGLQYANPPKELRDKLPPGLLSWLKRAIHQRAERAQKRSFLKHYDPANARQRRKEEIERRARDIAHAAIRDATYASRHRRAVGVRSTYALDRSDIETRINGSLSHSYRRRGSYILHINAEIDAVGTIMSQRYMRGGRWKAMIAHDGRRRIAILRVLDRNYEGGMLVLAGREEKASRMRRDLRRDDPVVKTRKAVIEPHPKREGDWRVRQWLPDDK